LLDCHRKELPPNSDIKSTLSHLAWIYGDNVHSKGEVILAASSIQKNGGTARWEMKHAGDHKIETYFCANDNAIDWIYFHLKNKIIESIQDSVFLGWHPLKSWIVEGCIDGKNWILLDEKNNCEAKVDKSLRTLPFQRSPAIQMIRSTQTRPTHSGPDYLILRRFEVFATITQRLSI
jgi:hypothetical protein